ncbi:glycosyl hydrolase 5 family protein-like [Salvia hispanica]|uniref:glycosyl hydrolase 5 family protein-like n=1 Tax=Salvia hispanica TaxID=49212 RepID=UPI002009C5CA|nr:glycosyl hydrolase 5 family protein-like [Salvia hispanica]
MGKGRIVNYSAIAAFVFLQIISICSSLPLSTKSRWIVDDANGQRVKLACVNWPSHLEPMIAEGLEKKPVSEIARKITANGFNCVRFTWSTFMFTRPEYGSLRVSESLGKYNLSAARAGIARNNPHILNMTVVELHKAVVDELGRRKVMVVLDNHISRPGWCCSDDDGSGFFGDADFDPEEWQRGLIAVAQAYKGNPAVVGMSMRNELRGKRQNEADWYKYMRIGANTINTQNPDFLVIVSGLQAVQRINQDFKSEHPTYYKMFHPLSGHCVQIVENGIVVANCKNASKWEQHQDDGPIKLVGSPQCLGVAGDGEAPRVSEDCSSKWKYVSSSGLHLAAQGGNGGYLCLEMNASDSKLVTKKCLCVGDDLVDLSTCADNPQAQWFKFIPSNI